MTPREQGAREDERAQVVVGLVDGGERRYCRACKTETTWKPGRALMNTLVGFADFPGDDPRDAHAGQTMSYSGPPALVEVIACTVCGRATTPTTAKELPTPAEPASDAGLEEARTLVLWLADHCLGGMDVDGGDLQDKLEELGFAKRVPATEDFKAEWDADEMLVVSWPTRARLAAPKGVEPLGWVVMGVDADGCRYLNANGAIMGIRSREQCEATRDYWNGVEDGVTYTVEPVGATSPSVGESDVGANTTTTAAPTPFTYTAPSAGERAEVERLREALDYVRTVPSRQDEPCPDCYRSANVAVRALGAP